MAAGPFRISVSSFLMNGIPASAVVAKGKPMAGVFEDLASAIRTYKDIPSQTWRDGEIIFEDVDDSFHGSAARIVKKLNDQFPMIDESSDMMEGPSTSLGKAIDGPDPFAKSKTSDERLKR